MSDLLVCLAGQRGEKLLRGCPEENSQHGQGVSDVLLLSAVGNQEIIDAVIDDGGAKQAAGACRFQPAPLPHVQHAAADDGSADDVHGAGAEAPDQQEGQMLRSVLCQVADVFKGGKTGCHDQDGGADSVRFWVEHEQIKQQRKELHHFFHHRGDLRCGIEYRRLIESGKKCVHIGGKKAGSHSGKCKEKKAKMFSAQTKGGHKKRRGDTHENVFNICHDRTAFLTAGNNARSVAVRAKSNQKYGLAGVSPAHG